MPQYRKKPIVIEAHQWDGCNVGELIEFIPPDKFTGPDYEGNIIIHTLEGAMTALPGDYIVKGIKGEFYPCKPDIFEASYDLV